MTARSGFTLMETVCAIAMLGFVGSALVKGLRGTNRFKIHIHNTERALTVLDNTLERLAAKERFTRAQAEKMLESELSSAGVSEILEGAVLLDPTTFRFEVRKRDDAILASVEVPR